MRRFLAYALAAVLAGVMPAAAMPPSMVATTIVNSVPYDPDAVAYLKTAISLGGTRHGASFRRGVAQVVIAAKSAGVFATQDTGYILVGSDAVTASVNLFQPASFRLAFSGTCTFSGALGLNGDSSSCVGDMGAANGLTRASQNNYHIGTAQGSPTVSANMLGGIGAVGNVQLTATLTNPSIRCPSATSAAGTADGNIGYVWCDRTVSTSIAVGNGGITMNATLASTSGAPSATHIGLC